MRAGIGLIGKKLGMTQIFKPSGQPVPVTVLEAGPCTVVQAKTVERDGYRAVQLGFQDVEEKKVLKPLRGHFNHVKVAPKKVLREFRIPVDQEWAIGSAVTVELFKAGDRVDVTGTSIGKGFQGGVKRWHWKGGSQTHGSMSHRAPGSIGSSTNPSRVFKGHHLPGHMGNERITTQALEVVRVDLDQNLLLVKGSVAGHDQGFVLIRKSRKPPRVAHVVHHAPKKKQPQQAAAGKAAPAAKDKKPQGKS